MKAPARPTVAIVTKGDAVYRELVNGQLVRVSPRRRSRKRERRERARAEKENG